MLIGWGQDDDNTHSPNEKFCLADFHRGIKASAKLWEELTNMINKNTTTSGLTHSNPTPPLSCSTAALSSITPIG